jgi:epoxyqueuosine reductase
MTSTGPEGIDREQLSQFFADHGVDTFAAVSPSTIKAPAGRRPADILPSVKSVILFGKVMKDDLFFGTEQETSRNVLRFKGGLNKIADNLVLVLNETGNRAVAVRSVAVKDGAIRGSMSLKHCARDAGFGSIGESSLLLTPGFGNRLALGAVLTDKDLGPYPAIVNTADLCHHCMVCVHSCPEHALTPGSTDFLVCRNVTGGLPSILRPLAIRLLRSNFAAPILNPLVNHVAQTSTPRCSACLMACPHFRNGGR